MEPKVRGRALQRLPPLLVELGADAIAYLARFDLPIHPRDDDSISVSRMNRLMEAASRELSCPDLGLRLAESEDTSILGPVSVAITASSTAAEALECASRFMYVHSPAMAVTVERGPNASIWVAYGLDVPSEGEQSQAVELGLGVAHRTMRLLTQGDYGLTRVQLPHQPISAPERYAQFFGAPVEFGCGRAALQIPSHVLTVRRLHADCAVHTIAVDYLARNFASSAPSISARVGAAITDLLGVAAPQIGAVAHLLNLHPRTLQRQLANEGTTFENILDNVRRTTARKLLTTTNMPMDQVATRIGLAEQASLSRAVRRWFGQTPSRVRRAGR